MTMVTPRGELSRALTFLRFVAQQVKSRERIALEIEEVESLPFTVDAPTIGLNAGESDWKPTGVFVTAGANFAVSARGAIWLSRPLSIVLEPRASLWVRISGTQRIAKLVDNDQIFSAWASGEVEVFLKGGTEWSSRSGEIPSQHRASASGQIRVRVESTERPATNISNPPNWSYLWRLGDGTIYSRGAGGRINIQTHGDVGILQTEVDHPISPGTQVEWSWLVNRLPSQLAEDLSLTHDYLAVAVEFDDGRDLTYMWSAGLPNNYVFSCPLSFWCDRETHWVIRTRGDKLGAWYDERRNLWDDTLELYGSPPVKVVRLWLIANSVFQRSVGSASVQDLRITDR